MTRSSISHKARLFDVDAFERELGTPMKRALKLETVEPLRDFFDLHHFELVDPWSDDEDELGKDWEARLGDTDLAHWADVALEFYARGEDRGLSTRYDALEAWLGRAAAPHAHELVAGTPFSTLDPGGMGTGFVRAARAVELHAALAAIRDVPPPPGDAVYADCLYAPESQRDVVEALAALRALYADAVEAKVGILFADFHE